MINNLDYNFTVLDRFLKYVKIDTQSDPDSDTYPSTEKQKDLGRELVKELHEIGIMDAELDDYGYVYATIESTTDKNVPVLCFCSHMDTSPDVTGKNVNPIINKNYSGGDIVLPADNSQVILEEENPALKEQIGNDIITTDGTTLLGADNKAGLAEIMDAANYLKTHPEVKHGKIRILFTPDEEIGRGVDKVDMNKLGAEIGYTIDGESLGQIENETFSADSVVIEIQGFNIHPGFAKDKMENAIKIASQIIEELPKGSMSPETTSEKEGFIHPISVRAGNDTATLKFIIRSFSEEELIKQEDYLKQITEKVISNYKRSSFDFKVEESYRNMKEVIEKDPRIIQYAIDAVKKAGIEPKVSSIRGGTDGSRLSFMGLPCPNIFAGEHSFHSKLEWISVQDMQKSVETIVNLCVIWEERSN